MTFGTAFEDVNVVDGNLTASGALSITDVDSGEAGFQATTVNGQYGALTIDAGGAWIYTADNSLAAIQSLDAGEFLTDIVTVHSVDGTPQVVSVEINGADEIITGTEDSDSDAGQSPTSLVTVVETPGMVDPVSGVTADPVYDGDVLLGADDLHLSLIHISEPTRPY